jgi:hypothetical protein
MGLRRRRPVRTSGVKRRRISVQFAALSRPIIAARYAAAGHALVLVSILHCYRQWTGEQ